MAVTRCTCIRDDGLRRVLPDPDCPAPSHLHDECQEMGRALPRVD